VRFRRGVGFSTSQRVVLAEQHGCRAHRMGPGDAASDASCNRRGLLQGNIVKLAYIESTLRDKNAEFTPKA
jgi:hypothetical protein